MFTASSYTRLVLKIGSSLLVDDSGQLNQPWIRSLAADIAELSATGKELVVVSSGAIALGRTKLGLPSSGNRLHDQQAAAAVGQIRLATGWHNALEEVGLVTAQILLTSDDTEHRRRYLNAHDTLKTLISRRAVPVVNENDTVATDEIRYGDNDRLAARVAQMVSADALILFSDVDGLYDRSPEAPGAVHVGTVSAITTEIEAMAGASISVHGTGGMATKLAAARIATAAGCDMFIANGRDLHPLKRLGTGALCTRFIATGSATLARKRWIAGSLRIAGRLRLDAGAVAALRDGKSLLPVGVTTVEGDFRRGDTVALLDTDAAEIARGLCAYDSDEARKIIGRRSSEIPTVLGYAGRNVLVHHDDLAWTVTEMSKEK